jgi:hypothetical protein
MTVKFTQRMFYQPDNKCLPALDIVRMLHKPKTGTPKQFNDPICACIKWHAKLPIPYASRRFNIQQKLCFFSIVPTAFLATSLVFVCFSLCSLMSDDRKFLALGGNCFSCFYLIYDVSLICVFLAAGMRHMAYADCKLIGQLLEI